MTLSEQPSPASISTQQQGFNFSPFECTHLLLVPQCVCPRLFLMSPSPPPHPKSGSNFLCLALGGSSLCSSSEQVSHPKSIQPSPVGLLQENSSWGACVLIHLNVHSRAVASCEVRSYFGADLNRNMAALLHSNPLAGDGVWVICCCR